MLHLFRPALRRAALPALCLSFALAVPVAAQGNYDIVELTDGTTMDQVRVLRFNFRELVVKERSRERKIPREKVFHIKLNTSAARGLFKRARKAVAEENWAVAWESFIAAGNKAKKRSNLRDFAPQFAYWQAYLIAREHGSAAERQETVDLLKGQKDTGFYPNLWEINVRAAMSAGADRAALSKAKSVVRQFSDFAKSKLSEMYQKEAEVYMTQVRLRLREIDGKQAQKTYQALHTQVKGKYHSLENLLSLEIARAELLQNHVEEARALFRGIIESGAADEDTMIGAYVGVGHSWMNMPGRGKEEARKALSNFMRAVVLYPKGDVERLGEACYFAIKAYRVWDPKATSEMRRIYTRLKRSYGKSSWASKQL
ncbi:MAG: hypothetical protein CSA62_10640 [Planctomycetota bacterium]|nr:MAG: hypothetical protein CSA62_10640 [Planctomycetota bacterium]